MVKKLQIFEIKELQAQQLRHNLGMQCVEDEIEFHKVGEIIEKWAREKKTSCFPEKVIEALILTEGLGQYVSKLACELCIESIIMFGAIHNLCRSMESPRGFRYISIIW